MPVQRETQSGVYSAARCFELLEAVRVLSDVVAVVERVANDDVHQAEGEGHVGSGMDGDVPVGQPRGAGGVGIDDDELRALAPGFFDHGPQVDVVAVDVRSPGKMKRESRKSSVSVPSLRP